MNLSKSEAEMLLDTLAEMDTHEVRQPGDIDAHQYAERMSIDRQVAARRLDEFVKSGVLVKLRQVYDPERRKSMTVWRKA